MPETSHATTPPGLEELRIALDAAAIVAVTDAKGVITFVNDNFCAISQYERAELIGRTHRVVNSGLHSAEFFRDLWMTISGGQVWRGELRNRAKDGSFYWVATTIVPFSDSGGRPSHYIAIRTDITPQKRAETELLEANARIRRDQGERVQAEKLSSIGLLAAGVAHQINNPLSGVQSCVRALRDEAVADHRRAEYFSTALEGLARIQSTVTRLLDYARVRAPKVDQLKAQDAVESTLRLVGASMGQKRLAVANELGEEAMLLRADRAQLIHALSNVLSNAADASGHGGRVEISRRERPGQLGIAVQDRGAGIPPELLPRVCDPFFSTKPEGEGAGLGLAVASSLLRNQQGELEIESGEGRGTRVTLWLPRG